jgi:hydrogenase expression/formation protein HypE
VLPEPELDKALSILKKYPLTSESKVIGVVKKKTPRPRVLIETVLGTTRIMDTLVGEMLPRIC